MTLISCFESPRFPELDALRKVGDSNPRNAFGVYTLSRRASSTTRATFLVFDNYYDAQQDMMPAAKKRCKVNEKKRYGIVNATKTFLAGCYFCFTIRHQCLNKPENQAHRHSYRQN